MTAEAGPGNHKAGVRAHLLATGKCGVDHLDWSTVTPEMRAVVFERVAMGFYDALVLGPIEEGEEEAVAEFNDFAQDVLSECADAGSSFITGGRALRFARWEELARPKRPVREISFRREEWYTEEEEWIDWYCPGTDGWVHPGDAAADPDNYGSTDSLWAYEIELRDGRVFWVGARADGKPVVDE